MNILFVCTGNTCRSPMAEKILQKKAKEYNLELDITSAGLAAIEGQAISENAGIIISEYGQDITHCSRRCSGQLLEWADVIITMTQDHKRIILSQDPQLGNKIFTLKELAITTNNIDLPDPALDIEDPFANDLEFYRRVAQEIDDALEEIVKSDFFKRK